MTSNRREFIKAGLIGAAAATAGLPQAASAGPRHSNRNPLSILILGGTGFIGPHRVREALRRGHSVTLFNRGRTNNKLFPDLETIRDLLVWWDTLAEERRKEPRAGLSAERERELIAALKAEAG